MRVVRLLISPTDQALGAVQLAVGLYERKATAASLALSSRDDGNMAEFEGSALQLPGIPFRAVPIWIGD